MAGRPPKAAVLKVISGTTRPDRPCEGADLPILTQVPAAPDWLPNAHAVKEWHRLAPILVANKLLTEAGVSALATLCALHGKLVQLWVAGETPTANLLGQWRSIANDHGLTPVAQARIKVGKDTRQNTFDEHGRKNRPA